MNKTNCHSKVIGIDPGKSGGISVIEDGTLKAYKCPKTVEDMAVLFQLYVEIHQGMKYMQ